MHKERTQQNVYDSCVAEGSLLPLSKVDKAQIEAMLKIALVDIDTVNVLMKNAPKESGQWNVIYKTYYDSLHTLIEALIQFDKIKVRTHECLFVYICEKHPELELSWDFFEKIRTKRNQTLYYGKPISYPDWKEVALQMELYVKMIKKIIEEKLKSKNSY